MLKSRLIMAVRSLAAIQHSPPAAQSISVKFERALSLFAKCHILYNSSSKLSASDANDLGTMTLDYTK